jgi:membrane protein implicated in regulation of membrane protease activity
MKEGRSSKATENVAFSLMGGSSIATFLMGLALLVLLTFRPSSYDPSTYWAIALTAFLCVSALVIVIVRALRGLKRLNASVKEDRRRIAAGLPLERDEP